MKRRLSQAFEYLFLPEDSIVPMSRFTTRSPKGKRRFADSVSVKAIFWAAVAIAIALLVGRLS